MQCFLIEFRIVPTARAGGTNAHPSMQKVILLALNTGKLNIRKLVFVNPRLKTALPLC